MTSEECNQKWLEILTENERKEFVQFKFKWQKLNLEFAEFKEMWSNFYKNISEKHKEEFAKFNKDIMEEFKKNPFNFFSKAGETKNENY